MSKYADGGHLERVSEFNNLVYMLDENGTDNQEYVRRVLGAIKFVECKGLSLECIRVIHESMLLPMLMRIMSAK